MRKHYDIALLPTVKIGSTSVPKLILGHLPFVGESYQGQDKNNQYSTRFSHVENTIKILKKAIEDYGVTVVAAAPATEGRLHTLLLEAIREVSEATSTDVALVPCFRIPLKIDDKPIDDYRRWMTYYKIEGKSYGERLLEKYTQDPILQCREGWENKFTAALRTLQPYSQQETSKLKIDYNKLKKETRSLEGFKILLTEPGSEGDFLAMINRLDLLDDFAATLRDSLKCPTVLATHHAGMTIPILEANNLKFDGYVTPVNMLGAMMLPTQEVAAKAIRDAKKPLIAIKPLAGGRIKPRDAFKYVFKKMKVDACMVGVSSEEEADEDLKEAKSNIMGE